MMLRAALMGVVALMAGCASPPPAVELRGAVEPTSRIEVVATLATNDCEAAVAADYTAVIVARRSAAALLRSNRISVADARLVQAIADRARADLDRACPGGRMDNAAVSRARIARAELSALLMGR